MQNIMIYAVHEYNRYTDKHIYAYMFSDNEERVYETNDLSNFKQMIKENIEETFIICDNTDFTQYFENCKVINLIQDTSDNFDLDFYMGHTFRVVSISSITDKMDALKSLYQERQDYIKVKEELGDVTLPNSKVVSKYLNLQKDNKKVEIPLPIDKEDPICQYFLYSDITKNTCSIRLCGSEVCFSGGGVHSSKTSMAFLDSFIHSSDTTPTKAYYKDLTSFYPSILTHYKLLDNSKFNEVYQKHIANKTPATKLVLNTVSGLLELYQPSVAKAMRITGQLLIYYFLKEVEKNCPSFTLLNLNTDGFMYSVNDNEALIVDQILAQSELAKVSTIKSYEIEKLFIKDVNNLVCKFTNGEVKVAGYLNYGSSANGKYSINNNAICIKKAILDALLNDGDLAKYIWDDNNYKDYQYIASISDKFDSILYQGNDLKRSVVRVYATTDQAGSLYKRKKGEFQSWKIPNIPDNVSVYTPNNLDKGYYIAQAMTIIKSYGYSPKKPKEKKEVKMANEQPKTNQNIYQKLSEARQRFLKTAKTKSGWNSGLHFHYFTLDDIVPIAEPIFYDLGIMQNCDLVDGVMIMTICDINDPKNKDNQIIYHRPVREASSGNFTQDTQSDGSGETYAIRRLYIRALDIVEPEAVDAYDPTVKDPNEIIEKPKQTAQPYIPPQREGAKEVVLQDNDIADETTIANLQKAIDETVKVLPNDTELKAVINSLYATTNKLQNIGKERATNFIEYLAKKVDQQ